jgi:hypothetical protein
VTPEDYTVNGTTVYVAPPTGAANGKAILYVGGSGEAADAFWTAGDKAGIEAAVDTAGYHVAGMASDWGNQDSIDTCEALYAFLRATFSMRGVGLLGQSMGGLTSLLTIAAGNTSIRSWAGIYPVCNLRDLYDIGTYDDAIRDAYGIAVDGSDYATKTAGHDPVLLDADPFTGVAFRFYASPSDTVAPQVTNTDEMIALVEGVAAETTLVGCSGEHGDVSHFQPSNLVEFFDTTIATDTTVRRSAHLSVGTTASSLTLTVPSRTLSLANHDDTYTAYVSIGGTPGGRDAPAAAVVGAVETHAVPPASVVTVPGGSGLSLIATGPALVSVFGVN